MRSRKLATVLFSASLAMAMAACGDDDEPVSTAGGGQPGPTTTAPANTGVSAATTTTATVQPTVMAANSPLGTILVDADGRTLYIWDRDTGETSMCTGGCATTWPPLVLPAGTSAPVAGNGVSGLTAVARPEDPGKMQVLWNGKPLYYYTADTAPGDTKGDGVGGTWHAAKPA